MASTHDNKLTHFDYCIGDIVVHYHPADNRYFIGIVKNINETRMEVVDEMSVTASPFYSFNTPYTMYDRFVYNEANNSTYPLEATTNKLRTFYYLHIYSHKNRKKYLTKNDSEY